MSDPYRTLGLEPGAAMADVKRAYRRLAKAYHPDSAGEAALPRFLAIHEAYEAIRTGRPIASGRRSTASTNRPPAEAWWADPDRARAAREQARRRAGGAGRAAGPAGAGAAGAAGRPGSTASGGPRTSGASGASGASRGTRGAGGSTGTSGEARAGGSSRTSSGSPRGRRHVRKATMGSTSYDEARDHQDANDPTWSGASWYGPSTGEYWIINPREYADPRKHGPEYQSRARRMAEAAAMGQPGAATDVEEEVVDADPADLGDGGSPAEAHASGQTRATGQAPAPGQARAAYSGARRREPSRGDMPTAGGDAAWKFGAANAAAERATGREARGSASARPRREAWAGTAGGSTVREGTRQPDAAAADWSSAWPPNSRSARRSGPRKRAIPRDLIGGPADDPIRRLGIALIAWPPIGIAAAALIGDVTGCATFSASCGGTEPMLPWLAQAAILGLLLLLPPIARILAGGAIGVLVALVPLTAFLVAVGGTGAPQAGFALAFLLALAWLLGIVWGLTQLRRRGLARVGP